MNEYECGYMNEYECGYVELFPVRFRRVVIKRDVGKPLLRLNGSFILALNFKTYEHGELSKQPNSGL